VHDVIIIGAGPAGLSAALWMGRCRRKCVLLDNGSPRNAASLGLHGFLTRDGVTPVELRRLARAEVLKHATIQIEDTTVRDARVIANGFEVETESGRCAQSRVLLLATGRTDTLPDLAQARTFYGRGLYHCPYCDGWEHRDQPLAVLGHTKATVDLAELLSTWSSNITLCTHGATPESIVAHAGLPVVAAKIAGLIGDAHGRLIQLEFENRRRLACNALFFCSDCEQKSPLPKRLGCRFDEDGSVICEGHAATNVPGLFVAGNVRGGIHLAIMAAAEGAEAGLAINNYLLEQDRKARHATNGFNGAREIVRG
jgi:thioredoxin reductase